MEVEGETFKKGNCSCDCAERPLAGAPGAGSEWRAIGPTQTQHRRAHLEKRTNRFFFKQKQFSYYSCWATLL